MKSIRERAENSDFSTVLWGLLGILVTVVLGAPAIYYAVHEKQPRISYQIIGDSKVLDVHQPVKELEIRYRGEDIYAQKKNLRVWTITVRNVGETHIRQEDFDKSMEWGIRITGAQIVDVPKIVSCNSDYLKDNINLQTESNNIITFQKLIFEKDKYFTFDVQLLHHAEEEPSAEVLGKVAGIERQLIENHSKDNVNIGFWANVFSGTLSVQMVRCMIFVVGTIICTIIFISALVLVTGSRIRRKSRKMKRLQSDFLSPVLAGKSSDESKRLQSLFVKSEGSLADLYELKGFLAIKENIEALLTFLEEFDEPPLPEHIKTFPKMIQRIIIGAVLSNEENLLGQYSKHEHKFLLRPGIFNEIDQLIARAKAAEPPSRLKAFLSQQNDPMLNGERFYTRVGRPIDIDSGVLGDSNSGASLDIKKGHDLKTAEPSKRVVE